MRIIDRFLQYIEHKGISENKATIDCGLSQGLLHQAKSGKSDLGHKSIDKISKQYQDLNISWLRTGEGEMLLNNKKNDEEIIQQHSSTIEIPLSVWQVIQDQAECIKLKDNQMDEILKSRDKQIDEMFSSIKAKDQQISDFITILKQQINQKGEDVGNVSGVAI